jgi:hypothetical protein
MGHGGKITHDGNNVVARPSLANETNHAVLYIVTVNPLEACLFEVQFVESWLTPIYMV